MARPRKTIFYPKRPRGAPAGNTNRLTHGRYAGARLRHIALVRQVITESNLILAITGEAIRQADEQGVALSQVVLDRERIGQLRVKRVYFGGRRRSLKGGLSAPDLGSNRP